MSQELKSFQSVVKGGGLVSIGMLINNVLQLISGVLVVRVLSVEQYGDFALGNATVSLLNVLCLISIPTVMIKFAVQSQRCTENPDQELSKVIASSFFIVAVTSCLAMLLVAGTSGVYASTVASSNLAQVLTILALTIPFTNCIILLSSYFRFCNNPLPKVVFQDLLFNAIRTVLLLGAVLISLSLEGVLAIYFTSSLIAALLFGYYFYENKTIAFHWCPDADTVKKLLLGGLPLLAIELIPSLEIWLVSGITSFYHNADILAYFSAPNRLSVILSLPLTSMGYLYLPILTSEYFKNVNREHINSLYQSVTKWTMLFSIPIFVFVFAQSEFIVTFLFGAEYFESAKVLRIIAIGACINALFGNNILTLLVLGGGRVLLLASILSVLAMVITCLLVIPQLGYVGAAVAVVASKTVLNLVVSAYLYRRYSMLPCTFELTKIIVIVSLIVYVYCWLLQHYFSGLALFVVYTPVAFYLALIIPRSTGNVSENDEQIYSALDSKLGILFKKKRLR